MESGLFETTDISSCGSRLLNMLSSKGWQGRIVSADHLLDLEASIRDLSEGGLLDEGLSRSQLSGFTFGIPADLPGARSIVVVAVPVPQTRIFCHWKGTRLAVIVPPTYAGYAATTAATQDVLAEWLGRQGYRIARPLLPLKTLAVRSGLAQYGRNNLCYVPGMGSFLQLVGALSDMPCAENEDAWGDARALPRCESCVGCETRCPTGAVAADRFLLHAERCLTYHNESADELPGWIDPSWHHCLVGCMRCQTICPENKAVAGWFDDRAEFSELETALLASDRPFDLLPPDTARKMRGLELNEPVETLRRNLRLLLERRARRT